MAIYSFSVQAISRAKGQSSVASASYRSGDKMKDERTGEMKFYKREVQPDTMILAPDHAPEWVYDRERLWNEVEKIESNKNSRLAREARVALPVELSPDQQKELIRDYAKEQFVDKGMVADIAIHRDDANNPHAHIMLTIRPFEKDGEWLKQKSRKEYLKDENGDFILNRKGQKKSRKIDLIGWDKKELVEEWRKEWANHANKMLEREGVNARIDHRSHADRELEELPTVHLGWKANEMEKRGERSERGDINREIKEHNKIVVDLKAYREEKQRLEQKEAQRQKTKAVKEKYNTPKELTYLQRAAKYFKKGEPTLERIDKRLEQIENWRKSIINKHSKINAQVHDFSAIRDRFRSMGIAKEQLEARRQELGSIGGLKMISKGNRDKKKLIESEIQRHEATIREHERNIEPERNKYDFTNEPSFRIMDEKQKKEYSEHLSEKESQFNAIREEKNALEQAKSAILNRNSRILEVMYPNNPEMKYVKPELASKIIGANFKKGGVLSVDSLEQSLGDYKQHINKVNKEIDKVISEGDRLDRVGRYLDEYKRFNAIVELYENNPLYKAKLDNGTLSKQDQQAYNDALKERRYYGQLLKQHHVKDARDLHQQKEQANQDLGKLPKLQDEVEKLNKATGLLDGIVQGIQEAQQQMEQQKEQSKTKPKQKQKQKVNQRNIGEMEL